ncbi:DUF2624 domain-containing protein [Pontibacillus marinus]|uniref:tRNA methyltransferase n=1 Tax=Pontibacillus marinus BH030004 = DSM 16465 TaxID=1385511 RepID=A0A0A5FZV6_9BACI|nr:DUF2624 domain-containing protein [Pontibacillus marinus]KGX85329.1 tRNA methyltransferase [Pontibacillus marinus BH030004 = DSM 16465]
MKNMIKQVVKQKLKTLTVDELISYANTYNVSITPKQGEQIIAFLKETDLNPLDEQDRMKALKKLAQITDPQTAQKVNKIFHGIIKENGLSHWF